MAVGLLYKYFPIITEKPREYQLYPWGFWDYQTGSAAM